MIINNKTENKNFKRSIQTPYTKTVIRLNIKIVSANRGTLIEIN